MQEIKITGVVLAGGRSSRMGENKALLAIGREKVLETIIGAMSAAVQNVLIAANDLDAYLEFGCEIVPDRYPGMGPLSGIHAALHAADTPWIIVAACDMPFVTPELFRLLQTKVLEDAATLPAGQGEWQAVIPMEKGRVQPLLAAYHISSLPALEESLNTGRLRMIDWLERIQVRYIAEEEVAQATGMDAGLAFFNMNSPADYTQAIRKQMEEEEGR